MGINEWAKREVELACKNEDGYGKAVMNSALKALTTLAGDEHSGSSIQFTKSILSRLIDYKPLTPLTGEDSEWDICSRDEAKLGYKTYQNIRCTSVFKDVYADGNVKYKDVYQFVCEDINNGSRFTSGRINNMVKKYYPEITMPYMPTDKPIVVFTEDFLTDETRGDFDTTGIFYALNPDGTKVDIEMYQTETDSGMVEITKDEYIAKRKTRLRGTMDETDNSDLAHSAVSDINKQIDSLKDKSYISDGSHTFDELYFHRMMLFSIICNTYHENAWKSWKHADDTMYDNYFVVGVTTPGGDFSYHYDKQFWDKFKVQELDKAPKWDGHTSEDITRLEKIVIRGN